MSDLTAGVLRKTLLDAHATWAVHTNLSDAQTARQHALGADLRTFPKAEALPRFDLAPILSEVPANPFLLRRRIELGHIDAARLAPESPAAHAALPVVSVAPTAAGASSAVDWRHRWGWPWLTTIKDQDPCETCWIFGATGCVESMTRIEHAVWSLCSEGDVKDGMGSKCVQGGNPAAALTWMKDNGGVADPGCRPYRTDDAPNPPTPDRSGRTVRVGDYAALGDMTTQKQWIDAVGPLAACFDCYDDFSYVGTGVYHHVAGNYRGGHCILIVGYDDASGAWLIRNSWGSGDWGMQGYGWFRYGDCNIDTYGKVGIRGTNPDPLTKRRLHAGAMIESSNGAAHRNFELVTRTGAGLRHSWRDGSDFSWHGASAFATDVAHEPSLTATTYNRNFELVYVTAANRLHHWFLDQSTHVWTDGGVFGPTDASNGAVGFIQSDYGAPGNFELVVRTNDGRLAHWWRINGPPWTWRESTRFATNVVLSAPALVQRRDRGLDTVCVLNDGRMQRWGRDDAHGFVWQPGEIFGTNVASPPCMIEGQFGAGDETQAGNYELCVAVGGAVQHWWRNNTVRGGSWLMSTAFGHDVTRVLALIEGSYGFNLEVVVLRHDGQVQHYWRDGAGWHEGPVIASGAETTAVAGVARVAGIVHASEPIPVGAG
jgi:hypothetical protein